MAKRTAPKKTVLKPEAAPVAAPVVPPAPPVAVVAPVAPEPAVEVASAEWAPPEGCLVLDDRTYFAYVNGVRYEHVSEAPDGRWVYRQS